MPAGEECGKGSDPHLHHPEDLGEQLGQRYRVPQSVHGHAQKEAGGRAENLTKPNISEAIAKAMAERSRRTGVNQDRVLQELAKIAFAKITDAVDPKTATVREDASEDDLACIQSIKIKPNEFGTEREIKMYDKRSALVDLGKHLGLFNSDKEQEKPIQITFVKASEKQDGG